MKYIEYVNGQIRKRLENEHGIVLYGQNISAGSCLGGLTRGIRVPGNSLIVNTPNAENTLTGVGLGLMLGGTNSVFFMKQLDFLFLGMDHLVNTMNFIRVARPEASFTIFPIVVDQGYQGMQSSVNDLCDFIATTGMEGYAINSAGDADYLIGKKLVSPGVRILTVSLKMFNREIMAVGESFRATDDGALFRYAEGDQATVVCLNFSLAAGMELLRRLREKGRSADVFTLNAGFRPIPGLLAESVRRTGRAVILDDSKCFQSPADRLARELGAHCRPDRIHIVKRTFEESWNWPNPEDFRVDVDALLASLE